MSRQPLTPEIKKAIRDYNSERGMRYAMANRGEMAILIGIVAFPFAYTFVSETRANTSWVFLGFAVVYYLHRLAVFEKKFGHLPLPEILKGIVRDPNA